MKCFLIFLILLLIPICVADSTIDGDSASVTLDNTSMNLGDGYTRVGIFGDNFDDNDLTGWTTTGGTHSVVDGVYKQEVDATVWVVGRPTTFSYFHTTVIVAKCNVTDNATYVDQGMAWGAATWASGTGLSAGRRENNDVWRLYRDDNIDDSDAITRTQNVWSNIRLYNKTSSYNYSSSYDGASMSTTNSPTSQAYPYLLGSTYFVQYWDDVRIIPLDSSGVVVETGNISSYYDAGIGYETYELHFNFTSIQNHTDYYRENATGDYVLLGANQVGNKSYTVSTAYQNTDIRSVVYNNLTESAGWISSTFKTQASSNTADVNITYWNPGSGGLVATYNVSNLSASVSDIYILLNVTCDTWNYNLTYSNGTEISNQTATSTNESLNFSIPLVEDSYNITESSSGAPDTKFEYWAPGWTENPVDYHFWFNCFWNTSGYPNGVAPNAEQTGSQHSLKITNNGSAAGTANIKFNESSPAEVTVYIDDDYTVAGAMIITNSYQEIGPVLQPGENVTLSTWVKLEGLTSVWEFTAQVEVQ